MKSKKLILFNDDINDYIEQNKEYIKECLIANDIDANDEDEQLSTAYDLIENEAHDLQNALKKYDSNNNYNILVVADFGLWYGRRSGRKIFKSLADAVACCVKDNNCLYFNKVNTTLTLEASHHDGVNYYKFYKLINNKKYAITYKDIADCYGY